MCVCEKENINLKFSSIDFFYMAHIGNKPVTSALSFYWFLYVKILFIACIYLPTLFS